jgi:hypothetical protein
MPLKRPLFRGLTPRQWLNLVWVALAVFFVCFGGWYAATGGLCDYMGADYRAFYASARIASERGFVRVYDLTIQDLYQRPLYDQCASATNRLPYAPVPMPYLPAFVLLFLPMALLPYFTAYGVWVVLNLALIVLYMIRFKRALGPENGGDILPLLLICLPIFSNAFLGQVNGWMLICLGEFFLAMQRGKDFRAGAWLFGLLVKPQTLILLLPGLLLKRRYKALLGFAAVCMAILLISIVLVGRSGLKELVLLLLQSLTGEKASNSHFEVMMNWRSLAYNLGLVIPQPASWALAIAGMAATVLVVIVLWLRPVDFTSPRFGLLLFCTFAATFAATWHSHVHMVLPLIPLILFLYARRLMPWQIVYTWLLGPPAVFSLATFLIPDFAYRLFGLLMLALNLFLVAWSARELWRPPDVATSG